MHDRDAAETLRALCEAERRAAWLTRELHTVEGLRDQLLLRLTDLDAQFGRRNPASACE